MSDPVLSAVRARLQALRDAARQWADPDDPSRSRAAEAVQAAGAFSELQLAFALNEQMHALAEHEVAPEALLVGRCVQVVSREGQPLAGLAEAAAVISLGGQVGVQDDAATGLVSAFLSEVQGATCRNEAIDCTLVRDPETGNLPWRVGVAVLDGRENEDAREALAEDVLLYDGTTPRCVRLIWAPAGLLPDPYLDAFAHFRGRIPASAQVQSRVRMAAAFAGKAGLPHAYLDDYSLLLTRGEPDLPAPPAHVRWVTYDSADEVAGWLRENSVSGVFTRKGFNALAGARRLGEAHRPGVARFEAARREVSSTLDDQAG